MLAIFAVLLYLIPRTYFKHTLSTRTHGGYGKVAWNGGTTKNAGKRLYGLQFATTKTVIKLNKKYYTYIFVNKRSTQLQNDRYIACITFNIPYSGVVCFFFRRVRYPKRRRGLDCWLCKTATSQLSSDYQQDHDANITCHGLQSKLQVHDWLNGCMWYGRRRRIGSKSENENNNKTEQHKSPAMFKNQQHTLE